MIEILRTRTFRTSALAAAAFAAGALLLFAFIYWQTAGYEGARIERFVVSESAALAAEPRATLLRDVSQRYADDLHRVAFAAVFDADGRSLAGELSAPPHGLPVDGRPHQATVSRAGPIGALGDQVIALARRLPDGGVLVVGRSEAELALLRSLVARALARGVVPAVLLALACGALLGKRTLSRVAAMNRAIEGIMGGRWHERLPVVGRRDVLDQLSASVNGMLDEIERLLEEMRGVGANIAHDLRTPLTRLRSRLEGGLKRASSRQALEGSVADAITDLDASFTTITALLRISEIDGGRRRAGFGATALGRLLEDVVEMWAPLAELRGITLTLAAAQDAEVDADREMLFEAVANLVDNAVKFAPQNGRVQVSLLPGEAPIIRVADSGSGIPQALRATMLRRFAGAEACRPVPGHGLGLSLVRAILRIHAFQLSMHDAAPGLAEAGRAASDILCAPTIAPVLGRTSTAAGGG